MLQLTKGIQKELPAGISFGGFKVNFLLLLGMQTVAFLLLALKWSSLKACFQIRALAFSLDFRVAKEPWITSPFFDLICWQLPLPSRSVQG